MTVAVMIHVDGTPPGDDFWQFWCPGCECGHHICTKATSGTKGPVWQWNDDPFKPTVTPSILVRHGDQPGAKRCHLFIKGGQLEFLPDCTHALAGKTVPMEGV